MWLNLRLHMHADRRSAWLGDLPQTLREANGSGGRMGVAAGLRAPALGQACLKPQPSSA